MKRSSLALVAATLLADAVRCSPAPAISRCVLSFLGPRGRVSRTHRLFRWVHAGAVPGTQCIPPVCATAQSARTWFLQPSPRIAARIDDAG